MLNTVLAVLLVKLGAPNIQSHTIIFHYVPSRDSTGAASQNADEPTTGILRKFI